MTTRRVNHLCAITLLALFASACGTIKAALKGTSDAVGEKTADSSKPPANRPPADELPDELCRPLDAGGYGYTFECDKRVDPFRGENTGLDASYRFGNGAKKTADVFGDGKKWLVRIPERGPSDEPPQLGLTYRFTPTAAVRENLRQQLEQYRSDITQSIVQALSESPEEWKDKVRPPANSAPQLKEARASNNEPAVDAFLKNMGFEFNPNSNQWQPTDKTIAVIIDQQVADARQGLLRPKELEAYKGGLKGSKCLAQPEMAVTDDGFHQPDATRINQLVEKAHTCRDQAEQIAQSANKPDCVKALPAEARFTQPSPQAPAEASKNLEDLATNLGAAETACKGIGNAERDAADAARLITLARHGTAQLAIKNSLDEESKGVAKEIVKTADVHYSASQLLSVDPQRRVYSVGSGVVFLGRLHDAVVPVMISICPINGCLRADEQPWSSLSNFGKAFSVEVGVTAVTLDKFEDQRRHTAPGFLLGASLQAVAPFRLSAGGFLFENQETRRWPVDYYVGLTLDAAKAIEMMQLFGLSVPVQLKTAGTAKENN